MTVSYLIILGIIATFSVGFAFAESSEAVITVKMNGPSTFYLDESNQIIRATVEIQNYTPSDGIYFMKVTHLPTQRVIKDFDIYPKDYGNDLWSVQIAYPFLESDIKIGDQAFLGEFEIHIRTEFGSQTASTKFSILESSTESTSEIKTVPEETSIPNWIRNNAKWWAEGTIEDRDFVMGIQYLAQQKIIKVEQTAQSTQNTTEHIPEWIRNNAKWWADGLITDSDFVKGIQFLAQQGIIQLN